MAVSDRDPRLTRLLVLVGAISFVDIMFFSALTPLLPHYAHRLQLSKGEAGLLAAMYPVGAAVFAIPSGMVTARIGVKPTVLLGLALLATTTLIFGFGNTYWLLDVARLLQGAASAFAWTAAYAWLLAAVPADRRGTTIGKAMSAAIGGALFGPVVGAIATAVGTGPAFASIAVLATALAITAILTPAFAPGPPQPLRKLGHAMTTRPILLPFWFVLLPALGFGVLDVLAPLHLGRLGMGGAAISGVFLCAAAFESVMNVFAGRFADSHGRTTPLRAGLAAAVAAAALLAWAGSTWSISVLIVAACMAFGAFWTPALTMLADASEDLGLDYAYGFALMNLAWAPGAGIGAAVGGLIAGAVSDAVPYLAIAGVCAASLAVVTLAFRGRAGASSGPLALDSESS